MVDLMQFRTKKMVLCAVLVALGIGLQIIESMIPTPINLPGGKLGLANIVTVILLYTLEERSALCCAVLRAFIGSVLYSGVTSVIYSVAGAVFAAMMMILAKRIAKGHLTHIGISVIGAFFHNVAQVCVAVVLFSNVWIFTYLPILGIASSITGVFTGYAAKYACEYLKKRF